MRFTTLTVAWTCAFASMLVWTVVWWATMLMPVPQQGIADRLWYAVSVFMLCPLIAVLGARRPGSRIWTWFVLVPLILVLGLPALTAWNHNFQVSPLRVEEPALIGYTLVLIMGTGNYFGTRYAMPSFCLAVSLMLLVMPLSAVVPSAFPDAEHARIWATIGISAAIVCASWLARRRSTSPEPVDRLWIDFRDSFGIVWAKRIQDRVNQRAVQENWPVRLEMHGLVWAQKDCDPLLKPTDRVEHTIRWLLRRFVDPEWIEQRLRGHDE